MISKTMPGGDTSRPAEPRSVTRAAACTPTCSGGVAGGGGASAVGGTSAGAVLRWIHDAETREKRRGNPPADSPYTSRCSPPPLALYSSSSAGTACASGGGATTCTRWRGRSSLTGGRGMGRRGSIGGLYALSACSV